MVPSSEGFRDIRTCPGCSKPYATIDRHNAYSLPLLLKCTHDLCESCIRASLSDKRFVVCQTCNKKIIPKGSRDLKNIREEFPVADRLIDMLHQLRNPGAINENEIGFADESDELSEVKEEGTCDECTVEIAQAKCETCNTYLCNACFDKVHKYQCLRSHKKTMLSKVDDSLIKDTSAPLSSSKQNVDLSDLFKRGEEKRNRIKESLMDANSLHRKMKADLLEPLHITRKKIESYIAQLGNELTIMLKNVNTNANEIEQSSEKSLLACENKLRETDKKLGESLNKVRQLMNGAAGDDKSVRMKLAIFNVEALMKEPDFIDMKTKYQMRELSPRPENCLKDLRISLNNCDLGTGAEFHLIKRSDSVSETIEDQPNDDDHHSIDVRLDVQTTGCAVPSEAPSLAPQNRRPRKGSNYSDSGFARPGAFPPKQNRMNISSSSSSRRSSKSEFIPLYVPVVDNNNYDTYAIVDSNYDNYYATVPYDRGMHASAPVNRDLVADLPMYNKNVVISHIESPSCFWVHLNWFDLAWEKLQSELEFAQTSAVGESDKLDFDTVYLAYKGDEDWFRVKVLEDDGSSKVKVHFIDYGYKETVDRSNLRIIENESIRNWKPLAYKCRLRNCYPRERPDWSEKMIDAFKEIVGNERMQMHVFEQKESYFDVDLAGENYKSVCDCLVGVDTAQRHPYNQKVPKVIQTASMYKYEKHVNYEPNTKIYAVVKHRESPGEFYLRQTDEDTDKLFEKMNAELDAYLQNTINYRNSNLRNLVTGMAVAAKYPKDHKWYRAEIISHEGGQWRYNVRYVDFGTVRLQCISQIRAIPEHIVRWSPVLALQCSLHGIVPSKKVWDADTCRSFDDLIRGKILKVLIHDTLNDVLSVSLYKKKLPIEANSNSTLCVNEMLVQEGKARGVGIYNNILPFPKKEAPVDEKMCEDVAANDDGNVSTTEAETSETVDNAEHSSSPVMEDKVVADDVSEKERKDSSKIPVVIVGCSDPYSIYVQMDRQRIDLTDLSSNMMKHYKAVKENAEEMSPLQLADGQTCAVLVQKDNRWCRAKVQSKISDDKFRVFLIDYGRTEDVPLRNIRSLRDEFTKLADGCIRCFLHDFKYENDWCPTLCQRLENLTRLYENYFMSVVVKDKNSMGITLWARVTKCDGPLEPIRTKWINIGAQLKALDDREELSTSECSPPRELNLKEVGSHCSSQDIVKWLEGVKESRSRNGSEKESLPPAGEADEDLDTDETASAIVDEDNEYYKWMSPVPLKAKRFVGIPTYVNEDMEICFQLLADQKTVEKLEANLQEHCATQVVSPTNEWCLGQICIAHSGHYNKWYRAQIVNIEEERQELFVEYVDYGNVDWIPMSNARSKVAFTRKPILCHKVPVLSAYKKVHKDIPALIQLQISDKHCQIELVEENRGNGLRIKNLTYTDDKTNQPVSLYDELDRLIAEKCSNDGRNRAIPTVDSSSDNTDSSISSIQDMSEVPCYRHDDIRSINLENFTISTAEQLTDDPKLHIVEVKPPTSVNVTVKVTDVLRENLVVVNIIDCTSDPNVAKMRKKFDKLEDQLNEDAIKQPVIKHPFVGRPCCTQFDVDGMWYRAMVTGKNDHTDKYTVYYLDYGNAEVMVASNLHQLKPEWYEMPAQAVKCYTNLRGAHIAKISNELINNEYQATIRKVERKGKRNESNALEYFIQLLDCRYCVNSD